MTKIIPLFLPNAMFEEVLYQFENKDTDLRKLIFGLLTPLGKQAKMVALGGSIQARVYKDGKLTMKDVDLKDVDLEKTAVKSDSEWIPTKVTKDEIKIIKHTVSNRLYEDLMLFSKVFCARLTLYNESLDKKDKDYKTKVATMPVCFEQVIQDNVVGPLSQAVATNIDSEYQVEFDEMEKKIEEKKPKDRKTKKA